jgi:hypothetical protein
MSTETLEVKPNQTETGAEDVEPKAGDTQEVVDTVTTEETGTKEKSEGASIEDIMSDAPPQTETDGETLDVSDYTQEQLNKKIGKEITGRKSAEEENRKLREENDKLKTVQEAPKVRPKFPLRDDSETDEAYQEEINKYQDKTSAFNSVQTDMAEHRKAINERLAGYQGSFDSQVEEMANRDGVKKLLPEGKTLSDVITDVDFGDKGSPLNIAIATNPQNGGIATYLALNPNELERMKTLVGSDVDREMGKLEARFDSANHARQGKSSSPDSLETVGGGASLHVKAESEMKDDEWYDDWKRKKKVNIESKQQKYG